MNGKQQLKGFTLIELIIVVILLGILAALVAPKYLDLTRDAKQSIVDTAVGGIKSAALIGYAKNRSQLSAKSILSYFDYDPLVLSVQSSNNNTYCFFTVTYLLANSIVGDPQVSVKSTGVIDSAVCDD